MFNTNEIKKLAKQDYEKAWLETAKLLKTSGKILEWKKQQGSPNAVTELVLKFREIFLKYGFEEMINPTIVEETEVYKQYGSEAPVILDRCFYLAGLPRPDIGISKERTQQIKKIGDVDIEKLKDIFKGYKKGEIEGDNLVEELVNKLNIKTEQATAILSIFPELKQIKPVPTKLTLRSHMTGVWFSVISSLIEKRSMPIKLFSIGPKFRREQKLDATHLYESLTASLVVVTRDMSLEDGQELAKIILNEFGFGKVDFQIKKATSKYYAPNTEFEIFIKHPKPEKWIEIGDGGFYSPVSLANYNIKHPVFNIGFGVERLAMLLTGVDDIRKLVYPQFYEEIEFSDKEIAKSIELVEKPETKQGREIADLIYKIAKLKKDEVAPCKFVVYRGRFDKKQIEVKIIEVEKGKHLVGPAGFNRIIVKDGNIIGTLKGDGVEVSDYMTGFANLAAKEIEAFVKTDKKQTEIRIGMVKGLSDINFKVSEPVRRFIESNNKKIDIRGPMFVSVVVKKV